MIEVFHGQVVKLAEFKTADAYDSTELRALLDCLVVCMRVEFLLKYRVDFWPEYRVVYLSESAISDIVHSEMWTYNREWEMYKSQYIYYFRDAAY
jgi:hypothetical protein